MKSRDKYFVGFGHGEDEADLTGIDPGSELRKIY